MPAPPLTHHEILDLVEPFSRSARQVNLAASDRAERKIVFKARDRSAEAPALPALIETLELQSADDGGFTLTRTLTFADGLQATLKARGAQPGVLLGWIDAVSAPQQFRFGPGWSIALSYEVEPPAAAADEGPPAVRLLLRRGVVRTEALNLSLSLNPVRHVAAEIELAATPGGPLLDLPEDLLAVQGWDWARLVRAKEGWTSRLRLRGAAGRRSAGAERALGLAAAHLARTLAEPPARFHDRFRLARWGVVVRRGLPTLTAGGMIVGAALLPRLSFSVSAGMALLLHYGSIGLLAVSFSLQELPRFEIPPWPRRAAGAGWRAVPNPEDPAGAAAPQTAKL